MKIEKKTIINRDTMTKLIEDYIRKESKNKNVVLGTGNPAYFLTDKTRMLDYVMVRWEQEE